MGYEMSGKTLGIVGIGHIGTRLAKLARAFDMTVLAFDPYLTEEEIGRRGARPVTREQLLERSDFVSLHCPRNKDTLGMMDAQAFARMKQGAIFVTTARGGIHDERRCLRRSNPGTCRARGWTYGKKEPPPLYHPLLSSRTWWPLSIPPGLRMRHGETWRCSPRSRSWGSSKVAAPRGSSIPKPGQAIQPASKRSSATPCRLSARTPSDVRRNYLICEEQGCQEVGRFGGRCCYGRPRLVSRARPWPNQIYLASPARRQPRTRQRLPLGVVTRRPPDFVRYWPQTWICQPRIDAVANLWLSQVKQEADGQTGETYYSPRAVVCSRGFTLSLEVACAAILEAAGQRAS